jgi:dipeptidase E
LKLLLTSAGIKNQSIHDALTGLLGKPVDQSTALVVPTGTYAMGGPGSAWQMITGQGRTPLCELGWKSLGVLELTALPSLGQDLWLPAVQDTDALLVCGGVCFYIGYWMRQSGLAALLPSLPGLVYVGVSGSTMAAGPRIGAYFEGWTAPEGGDNALGLTDFSVFPHLDNEAMPDFSMTGAEEWATGLSAPAYAIDDQTAIQVANDTTDIISEGHWRLFTR